MTDQVMLGKKWLYRNELLKILGKLGIAYLVEGREENKVGWLATKVWKDVFSGGEK